MTARRRHTTGSGEEGGASWILAHKGWAGSGGTDSHIPNVARKGMAVREGGRTHPKRRRAQEWPCWTVRLQLVHSDTLGICRKDER